MSYIHSNLVIGTGLFDFDNDGGLAQTFKFNVVMPRFSVFGFLYAIQVIRTFAGAGNASFGITYPDGSSPDAPNQFFAPFAVVGLTAGSIFPAASFVMKASAPIDLTMTLDAPITSGKLLVQLLYTKQPL